ncbi:hypothetical protein Tco_1361654 [Tanacetum coccineum]
MFRENPNFSPFLSHDLWTMEELHKTSLIGRGGSIAPITISGTDFVFKNHIVQLLRLKGILNILQLPTESVFEAWERFKSCLRKYPDHRILLVDQILTFYHGIIMTDRDKIMVVVGGNIMRKTPQEAYNLIENMAHHHFQKDAEVYYDTTTNLSDPNIINYSYSDESDEDEPSKEEKSEINPLIREPSDTL